MCGAIWIVFNALNFSGNAVLGALEINDAIMLLVTTANMTCGNAAQVVTTTGFGLFLQQRGVRTAFVQLGIRHLNLVTTARRRRFTLYNWHSNRPLNSRKQSQFLDPAPALRRLFSKSAWSPSQIGFAFSFPSREAS